MATSAVESRVDSIQRAHALDASTIGSLHMGFVVASLWISLFLSTLETTITVTALHHISDDLNGLGQSIWIVVADLLTYDGDEFRLSSYIGEMDYAAVTEHS